jgi:tRNA nucleotidyltransferase/poly(A) polymerase
VWSELKRILSGPDPAAAVALMRATGVLAAVLPEAGDEAALSRLRAAGAPADALLRLAALAPEAGEGLAERLRLSGAEAGRLAAARGPVPGPEADDAALRRALAETPRTALLDRAWLAEARDTVGAGEPGGWAGLRARLAAIAAPDFPLAGADVVAMGVPPGPAVGAALASLRSWWLRGGCVADRAALLGRLREEHGRR